MKHSVSTIALGMMVSLSPLSFAAPDFDRIHQDVTVMSNIIEGAFENERACRGCEPRIESRYLANQGAVFTIKANTWRTFHSDTEHDSDYSFVIPAPEEMRHVEIAEVVGGVLENLGTVMEDVGTRIELKLADIDSHEMVRLDSETRRALRELNRERRELEYQQREYEIELIHADDKERKRIEKQVSGLDEKIAQVEKQQAKLSEKFEAERQVREQQIQAKRAEAKQKAELEQQKIESVVLGSLCDYGATLKNIPSKEYVSVVFEKRGDAASSIVVMPMKDIQGCIDVNVLKADATSYTF